MGLPAVSSRNVTTSSGGMATKPAPGVESGSDVFNAPPTLETVRTTVRETLAATEGRVSENNAVARCRGSRVVSGLACGVLAREGVGSLVACVEVLAAVSVGSGKQRASTLRAITLKASQCGSLHGEVEEATA